MLNNNYPVVHIQLQLVSLKTFCRMHIPSALNSGNTVTLSTTVDTRVRNDTQSINASPVAALPPYTGYGYCDTKWISSTGLVLDLSYCNMKYFYTFSEYVLGAFQIYHFL